VIGGLAVMSQGEIQARLNVQMGDLRNLFQAAGVQQHSVDMMDGLIKDKKTSEFLTLVEGFGLSMAFVDHDDVTNRLATSWNLLVDGLNAEKKNLKKKITALKEDKKTDPDVLAKQEGLLNDVHNKRAVALIASQRFKIMSQIPLASFKDANFDAVAVYRASLGK
jgi:hypothetical protein